MNHQQALSVRDWIFVGVFLSVGVWSVTSTTAGETPSDGARAHTLFAHALTGPEGTPQPIGQWKGEILVVNFWATWCKPCQNEMPLLDALHRRMSEQSGRVIAISVDRDGDRVSRFLEENDLSLPVFVDGPEGLIHDLDLGYLPYTFVLDQSGRIVYQGSAAGNEQWAKMTGVVDRLLVEATRPPTLEKAEKAQP